MSVLDFLLINRSNYPVQPILPYAFVQVSALARRQQLSVERFECFGRAEQHAKAALRALVAEKRPRLIGITLRQADSQLLADYWSPFADRDGEPRGQDGRRFQSERICITGGQPRGADSSPS